MRKIELRRFIILIVFVVTLSIFLIGIPFIIEVVGFNLQAFWLIVGIMFFWGVIIVGGFLVNKIFNLYYKNRDDDLYYREIPVEYTPAIASLIYDNTFESSLDIPATMLSLVGKKVLSFDESLNFQVISKEKIDKLEDHEKYLCDCIMSKKEINSDEFKNIVIKDAIAKNLIVKTKAKPFRTVFFFLSMIVLMVMWSFFHDFSFYTPVAIILAVVVFVGTLALVILDKNAEDNEYMNTLLGKRERKKLNGLKHFLIDFSELDEKEEKYILLWDAYLAYAYMFGINNKIFNKFMNDKKYKKLFSTEYDII